MGVFTGPSGAGANAGSVNTSVTAGKLIVDISDRIAYLKPDKAPFLRLLTPSSDSRGVLRKKSVYRSKFEWLEQEGVPSWDAINEGIGYLYTDTIFTVDNGTYFAAGWRVYVPRTGEVFSVTSVSTNALTVVRGAEATSSAYALVDNEPLLILGHTAAEGSTSPTMILSQESNPYNLTEIIKTKLGVTGTLNSTDLYGGNDLAAQRFYKGIEHAEAIEHRLLFSRRNIITTATTEKRYTGGLLYWISTNITTDTSALTEAEFNTWLSTFFYHGSQKKVVFCSNNVVDALNAFASGKVRLNDVLTKKYGMDINTWISPYGTAYLIYHKLLYGTTLGKIAIGVDLDNVAYCYLQGRDTKLETNIQANDSDTEQDQYISEIGLECKLEKTHAKLVIA